MKPYYQDSHVTIYHGDCREVLPGIRADLMLTDPPFGLPGEDFSVVEEILAAKRTESAIVCLDWRNPLRGPDKVGELIWRYGWVSGFRSKAKSGVCHTHYTLHLLGNPRLFHFTDGSILPNESGMWSPRHCSWRKKHHHKYEKPVALWRWLLKKADGATILDPFCGVGAALLAAQKDGRKAIGIEIEERYCEISAERCRQEVLALGAG
jgi:site-specific DNA-methyltransferase (adenine-specific)